MERRVRILEQRLVPTPDPGRLVIVSPNAWSDADCDAWKRAEILPDDTTRADLIERYTGRRPRPCHAARPHITTVVVPAPAAVEEADEATRAAWRARRA